MSASLESIPCAICAASGKLWMLPHSYRGASVSLADLVESPCPRCGGTGFVLAIAGSTDAMIKRIAFIDSEREA